MTCHKATFLASIVTLFVIAPSCLAQSETKAPPVVPESEIKGLLKHDPYEFEFTVRDGRSVVGCPTIISLKSGGYAIDSAVKPPRDVKLPPSHQCKVSVLSRDGDSLRLKVDMTRTVGLKVTNTSATWDTQNFTAIQGVTLGGTTSMAIPAHRASGAGPIEVTIAVRPFEAKLSQR